MTKKKAPPRSTKKSTKKPQRRAVKREYIGESIGESIGLGHIEALADLVTRYITVMERIAKAMERLAFAAEVNNGGQPAPDPANDP